MGRVWVGRDCIASVDRIEPRIAEMVGQFHLLANGRDAVAPLPRFHLPNTLTPNR